MKKKIKENIHSSHSSFLNDYRRTRNEFFLNNYNLNKLLSKKKKGKRFQCRFCCCFCSNINDVKELKLITIDCYVCI
jgi:hypothetical protein